MDHMPMELIVKFLEYLTLPELCSAASVSRTLYSAAQEAGCSMLLRIHLGHNYAYEATLATFDAVVEHALAKPPEYRPGVALRLFVHDSAAHADFESTFQRILATIEKALPLFVSLDAYVPAMFTDALHSTLSVSGAPRLRALALVQVNDGASPAIAVPPDLFAHSAPRLRTIYLGLPTLDAAWQPVTMFRRVSTAHLIFYRPAPPIFVSSLLPRVSSLIVSLEWHELHVDLPPDIDMSGLTVRYLVLDGDHRMSCNISGIDLRRIPVVESGLGGSFMESLWPGPSNAAQLNMSVGNARHSSSMRVCATSIVGRAGRILHDRSPVVHMIAPRLTVAVIHSAPLAMFLDTSVVLSALVEFCVDFSVGPALSDIDSVHGERARLRCPALQSVTLLTHKTPLEIRAERVAVLGHLLRQDERTEMQRAILKLVRVSFVRPTARKRLDRVFPSIQVVSQLDPETLRLADACSSQVKHALVPYLLARHR